MTDRTATSRRSPPRGPGRPAGGDAAVRGALLQHARALFLRQGFAQVSTRRIAAAAGTTPAMIHYYFGDKLGLYRAMLDEAMAPLLATLGQMEQGDAEAAPDLEALMTQYMRMLAQNRWLPALIVQEVLDEGGQLREQFIEHFAGRLAPAFVRVLRRERERGTLRADLDPRLAAVSALSLCIFPFVSLPITSRVLGLSVAGEGFERLVRHTTQVFRDGVAPHRGPST
ncbi:MAG TPA: TetR/AcrR family transcriptional regulator [Steroidobacteraceae bacterium]